MTTNKECIKKLEEGVGLLQDEVHQLGVGMNDSLERLEESLMILSDVLSQRSNPSTRSV